MTTKAKKISLLDPSIVVPAIGELVPQARSADADPQSRDVRGRDRRRRSRPSCSCATSSRDPARRVFTGQITVWLWFTVLFANFAEAVAEGRGKAQAATLRKMRSDTLAKVLMLPDLDPNIHEQVRASDLQAGQVVLVEAGDLIPADGEVIEGVATVNESAITGESAPVIRESGGDRSAVTGGTTVLSDWIKVRITATPGSSFLDRMIALVEGAQRQKTPNEIALNILLAGMTLIFLFAVVTIPSFATYAGGAISGVVLIALFVTLIPTTIGALLSAIGIAGMDRLVPLQRDGHVRPRGRGRRATWTRCCSTRPARSPSATGRRPNSSRCPASSDRELADAAQLASLSDDTPEGRSVVVLAKEKYGLRGRDMAPLQAHLRALHGPDPDERRRLAGSSIRKGAVDSIVEHVRPDRRRRAGRKELTAIAERIAKTGGTPLAVVKDGRLLGVIHLKDIVKGGIRERFAELRRMGMRTVMITGDNPLTAAAIAAEAGVDDFLAQATPEAKLKLIREEQAKGKLVAMCGDGTNDAPALAQADVGVAMHTGTQAAREAGNMVDLDSDPTKLIEIVAIGKQLLMTRGALTTFSIANDVAKYFAIIPAMFAAFYPQLGVLNVMGLSTPESAILSAIIFNALIIIALDPAGAERREVPAGRRRQHPAPEPAGLRHRRHHHSVHRHQGRRPRRLGPRPRLRRSSCCGICVPPWS